MTEDEYIQKIKSIEEAANDARDRILHEFRIMTQPRRSARYSGGIGSVIRAIACENAVSKLEEEMNREIEVVESEYYNSLLHSDDSI